MTLANLGVKLGKLYISVVRELLKLRIGLILPKNYRFKIYSLSLRFKIDSLK